MNGSDPLTAQNNEISSFEATLMNASIYITAPIWTTMFAALADRKISGPGELVVSPHLLVPAAVAGGLALARTITKNIR
jgi:hypothetical protein